MLTLIIILVCNHRNGCITCECLKDDPPDIEDVLYNRTMMPYNNSDQRINNVYNSQFTDSKGSPVPKYMLKQFNSNPNTQYVKTKSKT